jgi:phenylalanyl-tRNA synthetase beta chain
LIEVLKLPIQTAAFEISMEVLESIAKLEPIYKPLNKFPAVEQDICLRTEDGIAYRAIEDIVQNALKSQSKEHGYGYICEPLDIYQNEKDAHRQTTWHVKIWHPDKTLTTAEVNRIFDIIAGEAKNKLGAERV